MEIVVLKCVLELHFFGFLGPPLFVPLCGFCVSADPAALFAAFDAVGLFNVLDAELAALLEVSLFGALRWDSALPAADFAALLLLGDVSVFAAFLATVLDVTSFFAIHISPVM
jgi:hypothetical protein